MRRFKFHEPFNRHVYVTVSTDTTFRIKTRVKVIVGDLEKGQRKIDPVFQREGKDLVKRLPNGIQQRRNYR